MDVGFWQTALATAARSSGSCDFDYSGDRFNRSIASLAACSARSRSPPTMTPVSRCVPPLRSKTHQRHVLPPGLKTGVILLAISPVATTLPHNMLILRANPPYVYSILISMSLIAVVMIPISLAILTALPLTHDANVPLFEVVSSLHKPFSYR